MSEDSERGIDSLDLSEEQDERARRVYESAVKIDGCVQIYRDGNFWHIDPGTVTAVVQTAASPLDRFYEAMHSILEWHRLSREFADRIALARSPDDIMRCKDERKTAIVLGFQSPKPTEDDLANLELFHGLGLRVMQIAYNTRSYFADGSTEPGNAGLSYLGREAIREMNHLGIVVDLSHVGERSSIEAAKLSAAPVICSHSNPRAVTDNPRNISDDEMKAIAATGGVVGISAWGPICWRDKSRGRPTIDDFFAHLDYAIDLVGPQHVSVGTDLTIGTETLPEGWYVSRYPGVTSDYDRLVEPRSGSPRRYAIGLDNLTQWPNIARGMVRRGFSDEEIERVLGGNLLRVFTRVWDANTST